MEYHRLPENPVNFIKVILSDDTGSTGIRVPKKFTEKHGKNLLERVILKVPNGDAWQVDIKKSRGEMWLEDGWREFAEHYGLNYGHFLVFKYEGFSIFGVIIFNASASEIVYPVNIDQVRNSTIEKARKCPVSCNKVNFTELQTVKSEEETSSSWSEDQEPGAKINDGSKCSRKRPRKQREDGRASLERAKANFKCDKPFFMVYMHQSYVTGKSGLHLPIKFQKQFGRSYKKYSKYLLQLANDGRKKTWKVVAQNASLRVADWLVFVQDNGITVGDICVFELIHKHQNVLRITILRSDP